MWPGEFPSRPITSHIKLQADELAHSLNVFAAFEVESSNSHRGANQDYPGALTIQYSLS
jgi:hypothetical protein